ncbi:MAG: rhomboid family intramembrane serine protease [Candidatus Hatepunaea meridiana]|nr:rhomboid family intramembrane serine protease [Candidatus Hatepunaea meridiana]
MSILIQKDNPDTSKFDSPESANHAPKWESRQDDEKKSLEPILITEDMLVKDNDGDEEKEHPKIDFEKGMSYFPKLTLLLIIVNTLVYIWEIQTGALLNQASIINAGALYREGVLNGEIWRLGTAIFLHDGFDHLFGNCIVLYILGMACEHAFHPKRTAVIYLVSGLSGSLLSMTLQSTPSVGASGAIFGVMGSVIVFMYKYQNHFFIRNKRIGFILVIWALYTIAGGFTDPYVDNFAHIGGLIGGALVTLYLPPSLIVPVK